MLLEEFNFNLPQELIAQEPVYPRHSSRMLVLKNNKLLDCLTTDLAEYIEPGSLLVFNNSKVIPAKFKTDTLEFNLHQALGNGIWKAFAKKARKIKIGDILFIADGFTALVLDKVFGEITIQLNYDHGTDLEAIYRFGQMPLPPYIKRNETSKTEDNKLYQTIYAKEDGSVAAPTAGLHFTEELFAKLLAKNIAHCFVTLHVGAGTFLPVKAENIKDHAMHYETGFISKESKDLINEYKKANKPIIAVGTTSLRFLESACNEQGLIENDYVNTNLFITPGYKFKIVDKLLTNFHLPCSTLFVLVASFVGLKKIKELYEYAITKKFRFFSYGDCCLLTRTDND